jgi:holo-[acyl-carrier protein] synthase
MSEIQGLGTDIIEIERIKVALEKHEDRFLATVFTPKEISYCSQYAYPAPHYAGRFAAKEAVLKAIGTGITSEIGWLDIEILNNSAGRPIVELSERVRKKFPDLIFHLSISHSKEFATATAIGVTCNTKS